jgi:hypothetical protein
MIDKNMAGLSNVEIALIVIIPLVALIIIGIVLLVFFYFWNRKSTNIPPTPIKPIGPTGHTGAPTPNRLQDLYDHDKSLLPKIDPYNVLDLAQATPELVVALTRDQRIFVQCRGRKTYYSNNIDDPITRVVGFNNTIIGYTAGSRQLWQLSVHSIREDHWQWKQIILDDLAPRTSINWITTTNLTDDCEGMYLYIQTKDKEYLYDQYLALVSSGKTSSDTKKIYGISKSISATINTSKNTVIYSGKTQNNVKCAVINNEDTLITGAGDEPYLIDMRLLNNRAYYLLQPPLKDDNLIDLAGSGDSSFVQDACSGSAQTAIKTI